MEIVRSLLRSSLIFPLILYLFLRLLTPWHKGVCPQTLKGLLAAKNFFDAMRRCIGRDLEQGRESRALELSATASRFAAHHFVGYYSSAILERPFLQLAKELPVREHQGVPRGTLHVMTQAYPTGGHTQLVCRWIELMTDQVHYVFITAQGNIPCPRRLEELAKLSGGSLKKLEEDTPLAEAAMELRTFAQLAEKVVLHTHMEDPLPLVAFGSSKFPVPVFVMNHADHKFWLGRSIADMVLELRSEGQQISQLYRAAPSSKIVSLPLAPVDALNLARKSSRKSLNLPPETVVLLTAATPYKLKPVAPYDIRALIKLCLERCPRSIYCLVGPSLPDPFWNKLAMEFGRRLRFMGILARRQLTQWFSASDIYIDSIPFGGGMTCLDAGQHGIPVVTHDIYRQSLGFIRESGWEFASTGDLVEGVARLASSSTLRKEVASRQQELINRDHNPHIWAERIRKIMNQVSEHTVYQDWQDTTALGPYQIFKSCIES